MLHFARDHAVILITFPCYMCFNINISELNQCFFFLEALSFSFVI